jgi:hypothetical protein
MPRQLLLGPIFGLVPENMRRNPPWLQPLRRALRLGTADCKRLFPRLDRGEGAPEIAVHQTLFARKSMERPEPTSSGVRASESVILPARRVRWEARDSEVKVSRGSNLCR